MKPIYTLFFFLGFTAHSSGQLAELSLPYEQYKLANGLVVVLQADPKVDKVSVEFWLRDGIAIDEAGAFGLAHFFEHVLPFQSRDSITQVQFKKWISNSNAQVKKDYSRFYLEFEPEGLELGLKTSAGRLLAGAKGISEARVERERGRVLAEIERAAKNPSWSAAGGMAIEQGTFGKDHPYGHNGYGAVSFNENFKLADFRERYEKIVYASNTILFVVGNFQKAVAKPLIEQYFSAIPDQVRKKPNIAKPRTTAQHLSMQAPHPEETENTLILSWAVPGGQHKHINALELGQFILNDRLNDKKDWPSGLEKIAVQMKGYQYASQFFIRADFKNQGDSRSIKNEILQQLQRLIKEKPTASELAKAQQQVMDELKEKQETLGFQGSRTELLGESLLFSGNPNHYFLKVKQQQGIQEKAIRKVMKKHLRGAPFSLLFLQNQLP